MFWCQQQKEYRIHELTCDIKCRKKIAFSNNNNNYNDDDDDDDDNNNNKCLYFAR